MIETRIREEFPKLAPTITNWQSDLYIEYTKELWNWLKNNYDYFKNCSTFICNLTGKQYIEIPFASEKWFEMVKNKRV